MYKISINDHPLYLLKYEEADVIKEKGYEVFPYMGKKAILLNAIDRLEKSRDEQKIGFYSNNYTQLKSDFKSLFRKIKAMGGLIINPDTHKILFIYRRGKWDLPKGKKEKDEGKKECALREVEEETGLSQLDLKTKVGKTRHTYRHPKSGERILKITHWYEMDVMEKEELVLQEEEDIEDAKWMTIPSFLEGNYTTFASIKDILKEYQLMPVDKD